MGSYAWCTGFMMCSFQSEARILPMAGLQISQPIASLLTPTEFMISEKVLSCLILYIVHQQVILARKITLFPYLTTLKSSARDIAKCGQRSLLTSWPDFRISAYEEKLRLALGAAVARP